MDVLEALIAPIERRFEWKGSDEARVTWQQDCVKHFTKTDAGLIGKAVNHIVLNRKYRTYPTVGDINDVITKLAPAAKPHEEGRSDFKKLLDRRSREARSFADDFVTRTGTGQIARHEGWDRSLHDYVKSFALRRLNADMDFPDFDDVTISRERHQYYSLHGQSFNSVTWAQMTGSKAMQGEPVE